MNTSVLSRRKLLVLPLAGVLAATALQAAAIVAYVEAPSVQATSVSNVSTENFNSAATGIYSTNYVSSIGTYAGSSTNKFAIVAADQYGGAGGTGNYFAIGAQSGTANPVTLTLNTNANYFGFWWSAGDSLNSITFLLNGVALATFKTSDIETLLPNTTTGTVTAINGSVYNTKTYYGNPNNSSQDTAEPFAYVDVIATGLYFNQIQFANTNTSSGFESDNHSVAYGVTGPPTGDVIVENVPLFAPEPGTVALMLLGIGATALIRRRASRIRPTH